MFFLLRSAFWLTLAYIVIKPGVALFDPAETSTHAVTLGAQALAAQVETVHCADFACAGGKAVIAAALQNSAPDASPAADVAPLPRPRPNRGG